MSRPGTESKERTRPPRDVNGKDAGAPSSEDLLQRRRSRTDARGLPDDAMVVDRECSKASEDYSKEEFPAPAATALARTFKRGKITTAEDADLYVEEAKKRCEEARRTHEEARRTYEEAKQTYEDAIRMRAALEKPELLTTLAEMDATGSEAGAGTETKHHEETAMRVDLGAKQVDLDAPLIWNKMYKKLAAFVVENGHCFPPLSAKDNPDLDAMCKWVAHQRRARDRWVKNRPDRVAALDKLGFIWDAKAELLRRRLAEMQAYISDHGDLSIPFKYPPNQRLAFWVHEQKKEYKKFQRGLPSSMTQEKIETLERAGFQWTCETSRKRRRAADNMTEEELWMEGYNKLLAFHQKYGHCQVFVRDERNKFYCEKLGEWATWQRRQHDLYKEGKPSQLTPERVKKLEDLGFVWEKSWSAYCSKNNMNFIKQKRKKQKVGKEEGSPVNPQAV